MDRGLLDCIAEARLSLVQTLPCNLIQDLDTNDVSADSYINNLKA
jgi:hypothetical protein